MQPKDIHPSPVLPMPKSILLADDDPNTLKVVIHFFKEFKKNYEVYHAPNGQIACSIAMQKCPDLIMMDWDMPIMNGLEATTYLKVQPETQHIPIVMITGQMLKDHHLEKAFEAGVVDYIRKPFNSTELIARINSALTLAESFKRNYAQKLEIEEKNQSLTTLYKKEKELLKTIIDHKARELSVLAMQISQKNELLHQVKCSLKQATHKDDIIEAIKSIEKHLSKGDDWKLFRTHFESVHPDFFKVLGQRYPQLNENELRLCAYVKMHLSNKEIAHLLNLSAKGMESARYRLKKRLRLRASQDLNQFVANI
ncbi:putative two-component response regulator protein [Microscilla marina ATCC 23134]|uniref:Putative two-component response regulator protein n=2 Tax=Microscilla marina TaxID=1027 RepID=A1ZQP0_MICM2|nr:putative two-component response regulator protein [Microscilla marina ATCC 23134]